MRLLLHLNIVAFQEPSQLLQCPKEFICFGTLCIFYLLHLREDCKVYRNYTVTQFHIRSIRPGVGPGKGPGQLARQGPGHVRTWEQPGFIEMLLIGIPTCGPMAQSHARNLSCAARKGLAYFTPNPLNSTATWAGRVPHSLLLESPRRRAPCRRFRGRRRIVPGAKVLNASTNQKRPQKSPARGRRG